MAEARHQRQFTDAVDTYIERVVEEVQQYIHDTRIDTTWPSCPNHPNHPMWFRDGWWCADGRPVARLGALSRLLKWVRRVHHGDVKGHGGPPEFQRRRKDSCQTRGADPGAGRLRRRVDSEGRDTREHEAGAQGESAASLAPMLERGDNLSAGLTSLRQGYGGPPKLQRRRKPRPTMGCSANARSDGFERPLRGDTATEAFRPDPIGASIGADRTWRG